MRASVTSGLGLGLGLVVALAAGGCTAEDDWVVRPPGGGTGSGSNGGRDGGVDGASEVTGRLCVVVDLRAPDACARDAAGVRIAVRGGPTVTTGAGGAFSLPAASAARLVDIAAGSTTLVPGIARVLAGEAPALRVADAPAFADVLAAVGVPGLGGLGGVVVYVDDAAGDPLAGVVFDNLGTIYAPLYDDGAATRWRTNGGTGADGVALLLGAPVGEAVMVTATAGGQPIRLSVPIAADALTFVRATAP